MSVVSEDEGLIGVHLALDNMARSGVVLSGSVDRPGHWLHVGRVDARLNAAEMVHCVCGSQGPVWMSSIPSCSDDSGGLVSDAESAIAILVGVALPDPVVALDD